MPRAFRHSASTCEVASPSARVYRFDAADSAVEPIYFVVDESIEF